MGQRLELQSILIEILGSKNVYFQPPPSIRMEYPCIVYSKSSAKTTFANNVPYFIGKKYDLTVIDRNPDSEISNRVLRLPMCIHNRSYAKDNLNHDAFTLFY